MSGISRIRKTALLTAALAAAFLAAGCELPAEKKNAAAGAPSQSLLIHTGSKPRSEQSAGSPSSEAPEVPESFGAADSSGSSGTSSETGVSEDPSSPAEISAPAAADKEPSEPSGTSEAQDDPGAPVSLVRPAPPFDEAVSDNSASDEIFDEPEIMYVSRQKFARKAPYPDAERSAFYEPWQYVNVVGKYANGYYKLDNGDYIKGAYLIKARDDMPEWKVEDSGFAGAPDKLTRERGIYDPQSALNYAAAHWDDGDSLCAEFVSECLTAGGLKYDIASATELYNTLVSNKMGTAFEIKLNYDGTGTVPDYVSRGDLIFYYCGWEEQMVHVALYNGSTADGYMKGYAHNFSDDGRSALTYYQYCPGSCGYPLDRIVIFCLNGR